KHIPEIFLSVQAQPLQLLRELRNVILLDKLPVRCSHHLDLLSIRSTGEQAGLPLAKERSIALSGVFRLHLFSSLMDANSLKLLYGGSVSTGQGFPLGPPPVQQQNTPNQDAHQQDAQTDNSCDFLTLCHA